MKATPHKELIERAHRARQASTKAVANVLSQSIRDLESLPDDRAAYDNLVRDIVSAEALIELAGKA